MASNCIVLTGIRQPHRVIDRNQFSKMLCTRQRLEVLRVTLNDYSIDQLIMPSLMFTIN